MLPLIFLPTWFPPKAILLRLYKQTCLPQVGYFDKLLFRIFFICMFGAGAVILALISTDSNVLLAQVLKKKTVCIQTLTSLTLTSNVTTSLSLFPHLQNGNKVVTISVIMKHIIHLKCSVQSLCRVQLFMTPWTTARQASLSITKSGSLPKLMPIESVMPSNHLILCCPLLLLPSIFPSIRVFSN